MLVPILLSLFWAVCSTALVLPWFWIGLIKRKTIIGDKENNGFIGDEKNEPRNYIILQCLFALAIFIVSMVLYLEENVRYNFYGAIIPIILVILCQMCTLFNSWNDKRILKSFIMLAIASVCIFFSIIDYVTSDYEIIGLAKENEEIPIEVYIEEKKEEEPIISSSTVASLFKAKVTGPVYTNGKFVYEASESPNGYGIIVINEKDAKTAKFIACNYKFEMSRKIREKYPFDRITKLNIVINNDVPFGKYAILSKPSLFGAPVLKKYVLQNMKTGDLDEYTVEKLPKFAE